MQVQVVKVTDDVQTALCYIENSNGKMSHKDIYVIGLNTILNEIGMSSIGDFSLTPELTLRKIIKNLNREISNEQE